MPEDDSPRFDGASPAFDAVSILLQRQEQAWQAGQRLSIEQLANELDSGQTGMDQLLLLICNEVSLRRASREHPQLVEYQQRFPQLAEPLRIQWTIDQFLDSRGRQGNTRELCVDATLALDDAFAREPAGRSNAPIRIGDYEVLEEIARGGMGIVYRAKQLTLDRIVALKMVRQQQFASEAERRRFQLEAEAAATLEHPHIVPIYDIGQFNGQPYYTMRLMEGGSLAERLASPEWDHTNKQNIRKSVAWIKIVSLAIHQAHQRGIIHRDLKPANILLDSNDVPYVADFGLAKRLTSDDQTRTGIILGTPEYMPPEQAIGRPATVSSDVYSLGCILYRLLSGRPPFQADSPADLFKMLADTPASSLRNYSKVDRDLDTICQKCLEKQPNRRYESALALAQDLERWEKDEPIKARRTSILNRSLRWSRRNPLNVLVTTLSFIFAILVAGLIFWGYKSTQVMADQLREERYRSRLERAHEAIQHGHIDEAVENFQQLASDFGHQNQRGWEWDFVRRKLPWDEVLLLGDRKGTSDSFHEVYWSPNGRRLVTNSNTTDYRSLPGGFSRSLSLWEVDSGPEDSHLKFVHKFIVGKPRGGFVHDQAFQWDPGSRYIAFCNWEDQEVAVYDADKNEKLCSTPFQNALYVDWSTTGEQLAIASEEGVLQLFDVNRKSLRYEMQFPASHGRLDGVFWIENDRLICISRNNRSEFFDASSGQHVKTWPFGILALDPKRQRWLSRTAIGNISSPSPQIDLAESSSPPGRIKASWSPNGDVIARYVAPWTNYYDSAGKPRPISADDTRWTIDYIDSRTGQFIDPPSRKYHQKSIVKHGEVRFSPSRPRWFPDSDQIQVGNVILPKLGWSPDDKSILLEQELDVLKTSFDGELAAIVAKSSQSIEIIDETGKKVVAYAGHQHPVRAVDWRVGDEKLASIDANGEICVWNSKSGAEELRLQLVGYGDQEALPADHAQVWWSPDGHLLAGSFAGATQVWDVTDLQTKFKFKRKDSFALGWQNAPDRLDIQIVGSQRSSSQRMTAPQTTDEKSILTWEANRTDTGNATCYSDTRIPFELITATSEPIENGDYRFGLSKFGTISLINFPQRKVIFDLVSNINQNCLMSTNAGQLWIADGTKITIFDGRRKTDRFGLAATLSAKASERNVIEQDLSKIGIMICIVFPLWVLLDGSIRLSTASRLLTGITGAAASLLLVSSPLTINVLLSTPVLMDFNFLILSILVTSYFIQFLVFATTQRMLTAYLMGLTSFLFGVCAFIANIWLRDFVSDITSGPHQATDAFEYNLQLAARPGYALMMLLLIHVAMGAIFLLYRFVNLKRLRATAEAATPAWIKHGVGVAWSVRSLVLLSSIVFFIGLFNALTLGTDTRLPGWLMRLSQLAANLLLLISLYQLAVAVWIVRNGGWSRFFQMRLPSKEAINDEVLS